MTYESTAPDIIFQSTLSVRRATRVELDLTFTSDFNPRSP